MKKLLQERLNREEVLEHQHQLQLGWSSSLRGQGSGLSLSPHRQGGEPARPREHMAALMVQEAPPFSSVLFPRLLPKNAGLGQNLGWFLVPDSEDQGPGSFNQQSLQAGCTHASPPGQQHLDSSEVVK